MMEQLAEFHGVLLENSYVLGISIYPYDLVLRMDFVLTPDHSDYRTPPSHDQECYRKGEIRLAGFSWIRWKATGTPPSSDADGEADYGCLDGLSMSGSKWEFSGDWGIIEGEGGTLKAQLM